VAELLTAAHDYIYRGLRVIALTGKLPNGLVHPHWKEDCFTSTSESDWDRLYTAFTHKDTTGIGILTGPVYYVVDIDGPEGAAQWTDDFQQDIPDRWVASTGRGLHLWFASYEQWGTVKLGPKLDFKGVGGYVAAPPSLHPSGRQYTWLLEPTDDEPPMEMPDSLARVLRERRDLMEQAKIGKAMRKPTPKDKRLPGVIYADVNYDGPINAVAEAPEGNRNAVLYWAAMTLIEDGAPKEELDRLYETALKAGLTSQESARTILSALRSTDA
jgi:hypothetical protein